VLITWAAIARALGVPVAFFSVGVDQLFSRASESMAVNAVRLARMRSFRDRGSVDLLRAAGLRRPCRVDPDPALGMNQPGSSVPRATAGSVIVVSPISFRTWTTVRETPYDHYLKALAAACDRWAGAGASLRFICSDVSMDPAAVAEVLSRVHEATRRRCEFVEVRTVDEFLQSAATARYVVASRLHGLVLSVAAGVPVIALSPARKVFQFMQDCELAEYCIDIGAVDEDRLVALGIRVDCEQDRLRRKVADIAASSRMALSGAYDELVGLLPGNGDAWAA
jgi:polysaccharide pyruvyl transferase WcaK-like protein